MKKVLYPLAAAFLLSCSDNNEEYNAENREWRIILNETLVSDAPSVQKTDTFLFCREQLESHSVSQKVQNSEIYYETLLHRTDNRVDVKADEATLSYTLNEKGYATRCSYSTGLQQREYSFVYSDDDHLTELHETIGNIPYAHLTFAYSNGDLISVASSIGETSSTTLYEPDTEGYDRCYLPCLGLLETYPLSLHTEALYAGLLGEAPRHFTARTTPMGNPNESTEYTYQFDPTGVPTHIKCKTTYPGNSDANYYPNLRNVSIIIE